MINDFDKQNIQLIKERTRKVYNTIILGNT